MLGDDGDGTVDCSHPNDLGMERQAAVFVKQLRPLLEAAPAREVTHTIGRLDDGPRVRLLIDPPQNYFVCRQCGSADGGCHVKNSVDAIRTAGAMQCDHDWERVDGEEYSRYCREVFPEIKLSYGPRR